MSYFIAFIISLLVSVALGELMAKDPPNTLKSKGLGDLNFPTTSTSRNISYGFGKYLETAPNIIWYGDFQVQKITKRVKKSLFQSAKQTIGFKYYVGMELALGWGPIDELLSVRFEDKIAHDATGSPLTHGDSFIIDEQSLFGGTASGGGVLAECTFYAGTDSQTADAYMTARVGDAYNYRGVSRLIFKGPAHTISIVTPNPFHPGEQYVYNRTSGMISESTSIKPMSFEVRRLPNYLGTAYKDIDGSANPIEVIYMLWRGLHADLVGEPVVPSIPEVQIDTVGMAAAALAVHTEGLGISGRIQQSSTTDEIVGDILRHINAVQTFDFQTGKIGVALIRDDYDVGTLRTADESNIISASSIKRDSINSLVNEVIANYTDPDRRYETSSVSVKDIGNQFGQNNHVPTDMDLTMFSSAEAANKRATFELMKLSGNPITCNLTLNTSFWDVKSGDVIKWTWPRLGLTDMVLRIVEVDRGDLRRRRVSVKCIEDAFALSTAIYAEPPPTSWTPPVIALPTPTPVDLATINIIPAESRLLGSAFSWPRLLYFAEQPTDGNADTFDAYISYGASGDDSSYVPDMEGGEFYAGLGSFPSVATGLTQVVTPVITTVQTITGEFPNVLPSVTLSEIVTNFDNVFLLTGGGQTEYIGVGTIVDNLDGTYDFSQIHRGLFNTVPRIDLGGASSANIVQMSALNVSQDQIKAGTTSLHVRVYSEKGGGYSAETQVTGLALTDLNIDDDPAPIAYVDFAGERTIRDLTGQTVNGQVDITWANRNRATTPLLSYNESTEDNDPDTTVRITITAEISDDGINPASTRTLQTSTLTSGDTSFTYTRAEQQADYATVTSGDPSPGPIEEMKFLIEVGKNATYGYAQQWFIERIEV